MAKDENNIIDRLFAQHLQEAESSVPEGLWEGIASEMETDRLRKKVVYARWTAAAALLLLLGLSTWLYVSNAFQPTPQVGLASNQVISLPFETGNPGGELLAVEPSDSSPSYQNNLLANANPLLKSLKNASTKPGLDLSSLFIDEFGSLPNGTTSNSRFNPGRNGTQDNSQEAPKPSAKLDNPSNLSFASNDEPAEPLQTSPLNEPQLDPLEVIADNNTPKTPSEYDGISSNTVDALSFPTALSLVSLEEHNTAAQNQLRSTASLQALAEVPKPGTSLKSNRWSFGGAFAPDYTFASVSPVQNQLSASSRTLELQNPTEAAQESGSLVTAFTTGVNFSYQISNRMGLQSGVFYTNRQTTNTSDLNSFGQPFLVNSDFQLNYLELPLLFQYSLIKRDNFDYYLASGISANLLMNYQNTISNAEGVVGARLVSEPEENFQPSQGNLLLRTGIRYRLFDKISLNLEPGVRYGILANEFSFSNGRPVSLQLNSGVNYHF